MNETNEENWLAEFEFYYTPLLVCLGSFGNCASIFVIFRTKLKKQCSSYYLAALAATDTAFLLILFIVWLRMNNIDIFNVDIMCQGMVYISSVSSCLSVWLVMAFTGERFLAVLYPLESKFLCTVARAKIFILLLTIISFIVYYPSTLMSGIYIDESRNFTICTVKAGWQKFAFAFNLIDTVVTCVMPVLVIPALNGCILKNIIELSSKRRRIMETVHVEVVRMKNKTPSYRMTKMLLVISTVFLSLNMPSYVVRAMVYIEELSMTDKEKNMLLIWMQHISQILFNTNFGINFILYCVSGQNFRRATWSAFCCPTKDPKIEATGGRENDTESVELSWSMRRKLTKNNSKRFDL